MKIFPCLNQMTLPTFLLRLRERGVRSSSDEEKSAPTASMTFRTRWRIEDEEGRNWSLSTGLEEEMKSEEDQTF